MDVRKATLTWIVGATIATTTAVFSEGGQYLPQDVCKESGIYLDAQLGYAQTNWKSSLGSLTQTSIALNWNNGNGGFAYGGDIGYQFNRYIGVEFGGFGWQNWTMSGASPLNAAITLSYKGSSYVLYSAAKLTVPFFNFDNFDLYAKAGIGYQHFSATGGVTGLLALGSANHVGPMFAVGGEYWITNHLDASVQLAHFNGVDSNLMSSQVFGGPNGTLITSPNIITLGLGYFFSL